MAHFPVSNYHLTAINQYAPLRESFVTYPSKTAAMDKWIQGNRLKKTLLCGPGLAWKDTVFISISILWRTRHVEEHKSGIMGSIYNDFIELHCCVHPSDIGLVPAGEAHSDSLLETLLSTELLKRSSKNILKSPKYPVKCQLNTVVSFKVYDQDT